MAAEVELDLKADLDHQKCDRLAELIEELTTSGKDTLDQDTMKELKKICKQSDNYVKLTYCQASSQLEKDHAEIRLSAFQIINELFVRSHCMRDLFLQDFQEVMDLTLETDPSRPLPPPKAAAKKLKEEVTSAIQKWQEKFGAHYKKLSLGYNYLRTCKKVDFAAGVAETLAEQRRAQLLREKQEKQIKKQLENALAELAESKEEIRSSLLQAESCLRLILPNPEEFSFPDLHSPDPGTSPSHSDTEIKGQSATCPGEDAIMHEDDEDKGRKDNAGKTETQGERERTKEKEKDCSSSHKDTPKDKQPRENHKSHSSRSDRDRHKSRSDRDRHKSRSDRDRHKSRSDRDRHKSRSDRDRHKSRSDRDKSKSEKDKHKSKSEVDNKTSKSESARYKSRSERDVEGSASEKQHKSSSDEKYSKDKSHVSQSKVSSKDRSSHRSSSSKSSRREKKSESESECNKSRSRSHRSRSEIDCATGSGGENKSRSTKEGRRSEKDKSSCSNKGENEQSKNENIERDSQKQMDSPNETNEENEMSATTMDINEHISNTESSKIDIKIEETTSTENTHQSNVTKTTENSSKRSVSDEGNEAELRSKRIKREVEDVESTTRIDIGTSQEKEKKGESTLASGNSSAHTNTQDFELEIKDSIDMDSNVRRVEKGEIKMDTVDNDYTEADAQGLNEDGQNNESEGTGVGCIDEHVQDVCESKENETTPTEENLRVDSTEKDVNNDKNKEESEKVGDAIATEANRNNMEAKAGSESNKEVKESDTMNHTSDSLHELKDEEEGEGEEEEGEGEEEEGEGEEDDSEEGDYSEEELEAGYVRERGLGGRQFAVNIEIRPDELRIEETADNADVLNVLRDTMALIDNKFLPAIQKWLTAFTKAGVQEHIRRALDLRQLVDAARSRIMKLRITGKNGHSITLMDEDEASDFEEVPDAPVTNPLLAEHLLRRKPPLVEPQDQVAARIPLTSKSWSLAQRLHDHGHDLDPTSYAAAIKLAAERERRTDSNDRVRPSASSQPEASTSSGHVDPEAERRRQELLKAAPKLPYSTDLKYWGQQIETPLMVSYASERRFWAPDSTNEDKVDQSALSAMTERVMTYTGEFEAVKWQCRAPLPNGKLCPRMDRYKCPFHGKVIGRDVMGNPTDPKDIAQLAKLQEKKQEENPDWEDPELQREIAAATGVDVARKGKGKGKGKKGKGGKYPNLTNIKKMQDTGRRRLEKKVLNARAISRVANALNSVDAKKVRDKFGDQFHYSLKNSGHG